MNLIQAKICLLGDFAVGKTSLVRRIVEGRFDDRYLSTIGVKISRKTLPRQGFSLNLILWDLAGGESFSHTQPIYLNGALGALIACDLTRRETLERLSHYADIFQNTCPGAAMVFLANKVDLTEELEKPGDDFIAASKDHGTIFLTSAKTGVGVEESILALAGEIETRYGFRPIP